MGWEPVMLQDGIPNKGEGGVSWLLDIGCWKMKLG